MGSAITRVQVKHQVAPKCKQYSPMFLRGGNRKKGLDNEGREEVLWSAGLEKSDFLQADYVHVLRFKMMEHLRPLGLGIEAMDILGVDLQGSQIHAE